VGAKQVPLGASPHDLRDFFRKAAWEGVKPGAYEHSTFPHAGEGWKISGNSRFTASTSAGCSGVPTSHRDAPFARWVLKSELWAGAESRGVPRGGLYVRCVISLSCVLIPVNPPVRQLLCDTKEIRHPAKTHTGITTKVASDPFSWESLGALPLPIGACHFGPALAYWSRQFNPSATPADERSVTAFHELLGRIVSFPGRTHPASPLRRSLCSPSTIDDR